MTLLLLGALWAESCNKVVEPVTNPMLPNEVAQVNSISAANNAATDDMAKKILASEHFWSVVNEVKNVHKLIKGKALKINRSNAESVKKQLASCSNEQDFERALKGITNNPKLILTTVKNIHAALGRLDGEVHFAALSPAARQALCQRVSELAHGNVDGVKAMSMGSNFPFAPVNTGDDIGSDCGGVCNNTYYRNMDAAANYLIAATVVSWGAGIVGGPAGMAAGALGIVGAGAAYYISADLYLEQLGDCFESCY